MGNPTASSRPHDYSESAPADGEPEHDSKVRSREAEQILAEADRRDDEADVRDIESDRRAEAADRAAFLDADKKYPGQGERRAAAMDRSHAKTDRESSAEDRAQLSETDDDPSADAAAGGQASATL